MAQENAYTYRDKEVQKVDNSLLLKRLKEIRLKIDEEYLSSLNLSRENGDDSQSLEN